MCREHGGNREGMRRVVLIAVAMVLWAAGLWLLIGGSWAGGGALIVVAGVVLVMAASGEWDHLLEGVSNWLFFWR